MKKIRNREAIRPKITTMPRSKSEASNQLELYKLVTEQQRIQQELDFIEQRTVLLKQRLTAIKTQIAATEKNIQNIRGSEEHLNHIPGLKRFVKSKGYQAFDIEY